MILLYYEHVNTVTNNHKIRMHVLFCNSTGEKILVRVLKFGQASNSLILSSTLITCKPVTSYITVYIRLPLTHAPVRLLSIFVFAKPRPPTWNLGKWPTGPVHHLLLVQLHSFIWWLLLQLLWTFLFFLSE